MRATIKMKLGLAFGVVIALSAFTAGLGIVKLAGFDASLNDMLQGPAQRVNLVNDLEKDLLQIVRNEKNLILADNPADVASYDNKILAFRRDLVAVKDKLNGLSTEEGRQKIQEFDSLWQQYLANQDKVRTFASHDTQQEARDLTLSKGSPAIAATVVPLNQIAQHLTTATPSAEVVRASYLIGQMLHGIARLQDDDANYIMATTDQALDTYSHATETALADLHDQAATLRGLLSGPDLAQLDQFGQHLDQWLPIHNQVLQLGRDDS
ncbi:MAG TPA: MCP four helix bundle domain-containing protein, partial [Stellaceae bacterium]|nr:MCP four helix bundle domain-containing protein [Stellaceae bacterium]